MLPQSQAKMFLAGERGHNQTEFYRSYNTFNFGFYQHEHKAPFSKLYVFNDDTLAAGNSVTMQIEEPTIVVLLPIVGSIEYTDSYTNTGIVSPGEVIILELDSDSKFTLTNPYQNDLINFIQLWIKRDLGSGLNKPQLHNFDLHSQLNHLLPCFTLGLGVGKINGYVAQFAGREEAVFKLNQPGKAVFAFVIDGAFEFQYRLLHPRDAVAVWHVNEVELEALSNNAIILLLEIPV